MNKEHINFFITIVILMIFSIPVIVLWGIYNLIIFIPKMLLKYLLYLSKIERVEEIYIRPKSSLL